MDSQGRQAGVGDVGDEWIEYWDDMSGEPLDSEMVRKARQEEMEEFRKHQVYVKVPIQECIDKTERNP